MLALIEIAEDSEESLLNDFKDFGAEVGKLKSTLLKLIDKSNKKTDSHPELEKRKIKSGKLKAILSGIFSADFFGSFSGS